MMSYRGHGMKSLFAFVTISVAGVLAIGCSPGTATTTTPATPNAVTGAAFVVGTMLLLQE